MAYRVRYHPLVEADLQSIHDMIEAYAGAATARRKLAEIIRFVERLAHFPKIGSLRSDIAPDLRAIPASEKAVVCFRVDDARHEVLVYLLSYAGADWSKQVAARQAG